MTAEMVVLLLGFGLGVSLLRSDKRSEPRLPLRDRAIAAQREAAKAAARSRTLTELWLDEQARNTERA